MSAKVISMPQLESCPLSGPANMRQRIPGVLELPSADQIRAMLQAAKVDTLDQIEIIPGLTAEESLEMFLAA